jgi:hypothetical protein
VLTIGGETPEALAHYLVHLGMDFSLIEPAEMAEALQVVARRLLAGARTAARVEPRPGSAPAPDLALTSSRGPISAD